MEHHDTGLEHDAEKVGIIYLYFNAPCKYLSQKKPLKDSFLNFWPTLKSINISSNLYCLELSLQYLINVIQSIQSKCVLFAFCFRFLDTGF